MSWVITILSRKSKFLWMILGTSLITIAVLHQVQQLLKPFSFEKHKFWFYNLEQEEPLAQDQTCQFPRVHPFDPSILEYLSPPKVIKCKERQPSLTFIDDNGVLKLNETSVKIYHYQVSSIYCFYQYIIRENDFTVSYGEKIQIPANGSEVNSDFIYVSCINSNGFSFYSNIHSHIVLKARKATQPVNQLVKESVYNILIVGIDSLSRQSFMRQLPETYEFLTKRLNAFLFRGMTKIGDNTFPNLVAILTGKSVINNELPEVKKNKGSYDEWPCLWKNFSSFNYATFYAEDQPHINIFTYLRGGLKNQPTDHYMRPFWLAVANSKLLAISSNLCFGNVPKHILQLNYMRRFIQKYSKSKIPFFAFSFFVELTHDYARIVSAADGDFKAWLSELLDSGSLKNTFLFFLSDHGHRFDSMRATLVGRIEERMPFFALMVPPSFRESHPQIINSLKLNEQRLVTPYDIYFSIMDLLTYSTNESELGSTTSPRGTTLFSPISKRRTCENAGIPEHYCVCEREETLDASDSRSLKAAGVLLSNINNFIQMTYGNYCSELSLKKVIRSDIIIPPKEVIVNSRLYFGYVKQDGQAKGMFGKMRVVIKTDPGDAMFEATLQFRDDYEKYTVLGDISRINQYGNQSHCIKDDILKKYCYCIQ